MDNNNNNYGCGPGCSTLMLGFVLIVVAGYILQAFGYK